MSTFTLQDYFTFQPIRLVNKLAKQQWTLEVLARMVDEEFVPEISTWRNHKSEMAEYLFLLLLVMFVGFSVVANTENLAD